MSDIAKLQIGENSYEFPLVKGTENEVAIDIKSLRTATNGVITIDAGFKNTGSCESGITFLDGEKGILRYRGFSIEELTEKADFLELAFLWIFGQLPNKDQLDKFLCFVEEGRLKHQYDANSAIRSVKVVEAFIQSNSSGKKVYMERNERSSF